MTTFGSKRTVVGAHYGMRDWLSQRVTATLMALFTIVLLLQLLFGGPLGGCGACRYREKAPPALFPKANSCPPHAGPRALNDSKHHKYVLLTVHNLSPLLIPELYFLIN